MNSVEGFAQIGGHRIWHRKVGKGRIPLLVVHGGPGFTHFYLDSLEGLASEDRQVVMYDQLGCGWSDKPGDKSLMTMGYLVSEIDGIRRELGLDRIHLLGHSCGGSVALEYALKRPEGVESLILASAAASMPAWQAEIDRLRSELPEELISILDKCEMAGAIDTPEYADATLEFNKRHVCRIYPWPDSFAQAQEAAGYDVYQAMWGPTDFRITGNLAGWDRVDRLKDLEIPTLVTCGRYDIATPKLAEDIRVGIRGAQLVVFEKSAHLPHIEEGDRYLACVEAFLQEVERT